MKDFFCGWYFKCQSPEQTLAVIPAFHKGKEGKSCSIQLITEEGAWNVKFPYDCFQKGKKELSLRIGENYFGADGIRLAIKGNRFSAIGEVRFGALSPIRYDIMGPFQYLPLMECRHSIFSMRHSVSGELQINGTPYQFPNGVGYIEGDRGFSFPKQYAWTQCCFEEGSLMLSVAEIPLGPFRFTDTICVIYWQGKEYRLATYLGAKVVKLGKGQILLHQGNLTFFAKQMETRSHDLRAPAHGSMTRIIRESATCRAAYAFQVNNHTVFSFETNQASFEYEYPF